MKMLPTGTQSFNVIRSSDMVYVDKTASIYQMIKSGRQFFISRPRRFGKSLLVSTLESLFSKGTEMFKGLAIEKVWTDKTYKVIHLDFSGVMARTEDEFNESAKNMIFALTEGIIDREKPEYSKCKTIAELFREIAVRAEDLSLVLLIDEYDAPLNFNLQNKEVFSAINLQIRSFYTVIKQFEGKFRFIFVTGVSRFNKVALFSAGSSIADITYGSEFSSMFGYTEDEIKTYFGDHLRAAAASIFNVSYDEVTDIQISQIMDELRRHYDGYCFDKKASTHVYQPWSVLQFLSTNDDHEFSDYWFQDSGVSTLVSNFIQLIGGVTVDDRNIHSTDWKKFEINTDLNSPSNRLAVLTQCGYFTIKKSIAGSVFVGLPNLELLHAWAYLLTDTMMHSVNASGDDINRMRVLKGSLSSQDVSANALSDLFNSIYKVLNSSNRIDTEYDACDIPMLYCLGSGYDVRTEVPEKGGRADLTFEFTDRRMVIEMKCARDGEDAGAGAEVEHLFAALNGTLQLAHIESRDYGKYAPLKKLRRFAMVFSVPEQKIVLAAEVKDGEL